MDSQFGLLLPYILIGSGAGILGGMIASFWFPGIYARSAIQHFAAGVVIAAVASELIPEVEKIGTATGIIGGFAAGGLVMIALKWVILKFEKAERNKKQLPFGLASAAAMDTLIDGAIITAGFSTGERLGTILAFALALELFFLTLSVGAEFQHKKATHWQSLAVTTGIALLLLVGAFVAFLFLKDTSDATLAVFLSFGAAALIYLIAEELLVESVEAEESLFSTAMLFAGFAAIVALKLFSSKDL